jgi:hypothetical protein
MGGLVRTKGTILLARHFEKAFKANRLDDLRTQPIDGTTIPIKSVFNDPSMTLLDLTNIVKHPHSGHPQKKCLLPDSYPPGHGHLEKRWLYFLGNHPNVLTSSNHVKIREAIFKVLDDTSYDHIEFDCIECPTQDVFSADEYDNSGGNPRKYLRIVLGTRPMSKFTGDPNLELDPQGGYSFNFAGYGNGDE